MSESTLHPIKVSIRWQLTLLILFLVAFTVAVLTWQQINAQHHMLSNELQTQTRLMKENLTMRAQARLADLAEQVENALASMNLSGMRNVIERMAAGHEEILWGSLVGKNGMVYVHTAQTELIGTRTTPAATDTAILVHEQQVNGRNAIEVSRLILFGSKPWGRLNLVYSLSELEVEIALGEARIRRQMHQATTQTLLLSGVFMLIFAVVVFAIASRMTRPLIALTQRVRRLTEGDFSAIQGEKSMRGDEIGMLWDDFLVMSDRLAQSYQQLEAYNTQLQRMVEERTAQLQRKTMQVQQLLDNSGQGFLSFGTNLKVKPEFSRECHHFFGDQIAHQAIETLLLPEQLEQQAMLRKNLQLFFNSQDSLQRELLLGLLPVEFHCHNRFLAAEYRPLDNTQIMLILSDITQEKRLEAKVQAEQVRFKFVVTVMKDVADVKEVIYDFQRFMATNATVSQAVALLYRQIHTFKGLFLQFEFPCLSKALHQIESDLRDREAELVLQTLSSFSALNTALAEDLAVIEDVLGHDFLQESRDIPIPVERLAALEAMATKLTQNDGLVQDEKILDALCAIRTLRYVDFRSLLATYPKATLQLAERLGKALKLFNISGESILVDPHHFTALTKSLVHVFRNAVVHGLETPEERVDANKPEAGQIICAVQRQHNALVLTISDDGRGINTEALRQRIVENGLLDASVAEQMTKTEVLQHIFVDAVSTAQQVDDFSGRGVGLAAVQAEVVRLGGTVQVTSQQGVGTQFILTLPLPTSTTLRFNCLPKKDFL